MLITIKSDKDLKQIYDIDIDVLEYVCNIYIKSCFPTSRKKRTINIKIVSADNEPAECCYFFNNGEKSEINLLQTLKGGSIFFKYFVHEFRHFIQERYLKIKHSKTVYDSSTSKSYRSSPLEVDARKFCAKEYRRFYRLYMSLLKQKGRLHSVTEYAFFNGFTK